MRGARAALLTAALALGCAMRVVEEFEPLVTDLPGGLPSSEAVELWPGPLERSYREIGILRVEGRAEVGLLEYRMRRAARERRADAVIQVRLAERRPAALPAPFRWFRLPPVRRLEGTAVVFTPAPSVGHAEGTSGAGGGR